MYLQPRKRVALPYRQEILEVETFHVAALVIGPEMSVKACGRALDFDRILSLSVLGQSQPLEAD